ncbi:MAG: hypothetical protein AABY18_06685 [Candidatus Thermoplasmatota archaeon]
MRLLLAVPFLLAILAGCVSDNDGQDPAPPVVGDGRLLLTDLLNQTVANLANMTFESSMVYAAVSVANDLYEPTIDVCDDGSIYITGHTILVDTTGAPVFGSHDDGKTWAQLPLLQSLASPLFVQGATPPPSDEIFLSCGDNGWLYGVDITLATYPINAWDGYGTRHAYHNPNAYNEAEVVTDAQTETQCVPVPAKDRPWGAYANGTLLLVSNPAGGPAQVGVMTAPPATPVALGTVVNDIQWNLCAGPGGSIPGVPDIRHDGFFGVPQLSGGSLMIVVGNRDDIAATNIVEAFPVDSLGEITSYYGHVAFDTPGTMFVGITNNTWHVEQVNGTDFLGRPTVSNVNVADDGQLLFAVSLDDGSTFVNRTYTVPGKPVRHFYMDANEQGAGALVVWAIDGSTKNANNNTAAWDWYVGHLQVDATGAPELTGVYLAINEGPQPSAHVTGAAVGPDGRAYLAMYEGDKTTPLSVFIQRSGPTLPSWM